MTKAELIAQVAKETGVDKSVVAGVVNSTVEAIKSALVRKEPVYMRGFGSFIIKSRAAKTARHIRKNITINVPARDVAAFKPARELCDAVK